jgi:hypothetical protein
MKRYISVSITIAKLSETSVEKKELQFLVKDTFGDETTLELIVR